MYLTKMVSDSHGRETEVFNTDLSEQVLPSFAGTGSTLINNQIKKIYSYVDTALLSNNFLKEEDRLKSVYDILFDLCGNLFSLEQFDPLDRINAFEKTTEFLTDLVKEIGSEKDIPILREIFETTVPLLFTADPKLLNDSVRLKKILKTLFDAAGPLKNSHFAIGGIYEFGINILLEKNGELISDPAHLKKALEIFMLSAQKMSEKGNLYFIYRHVKEMLSAQPSDMTVEKWLKAINIFIENAFSFPNKETMYVKSALFDLLSNYSRQSGVKHREITLEAFADFLKQKNSSGLILSNQFFQLLKTVFMEAPGSFLDVNAFENFTNVYYQEPIQAFKDDLGDILDYLISFIEYHSEMFVNPDYEVHRQIIGELIKNPNQLMMQAKAGIFWLTVDQILFLFKYAEEKVPREKRLEFFRGLSNMVRSGALLKGSSIEEMEILLNDFVPRFGYLSDSNLVWVHRALYQNKALDGDILKERGAMNFGISETGQKGIDQLQKAYYQLMHEITETGNIDPKKLNSQIGMGLVGAITGFSTAQWGHGSHKELNLKKFIDDFSQNQKLKKIPEIHPEWKELTREYFVTQLGDVDFTQDALNKYEELKTMLQKAVGTATDLPKALKTYQEEIQKILQNELSENEKEILSKKGNPKALIGLEQRKNVLSDIHSKITECNTLIELCKLLIQSSKNYQNFIREILLCQTFLDHPLLNEKFKMLVKRPLSRSFISQYKEMRDDTLSDHVLKEIKDPKIKKEFMKYFLPAIFENLTGPSKLESIEGTPAKIKAFATKGILGEMAGDIGDACYTAVLNLMEHKHITAVIFSQELGDDEINKKKLTGSMLLLENTSAGEPVLIMRAVNPSDTFLGTYSAVDFLNAAIKYTYALAEARGIKTVLIPINNVGALSNRTDIIDQFSNFVEGDFISIDTSENLNGYQLQTEVLKKVKRPKEK